MSNLDKSFLANSVWKSDIFKGKVAFITGGAGTIGRDQAAALVLLGADVAIVGRRKDNTERVGSELAKLRDGAKVLSLGGVDVRDVKALKAAADRTAQELGGIDFVIAGAAGNFLASFSNLSTNAFKTVVDIDLIGSYNTAKATFEHVRKSKGVYLFISAGLHYAGTPFQNHATAAKAGVDALSNNLSIELGPLGIRSNVVSPGPIDNTVGLERLSSGIPIENSIPLQKLGTTRDIAEATIYLLSDASQYVTGTTLVVDGAQWRMASIGSVAYPKNVIEQNGENIKNKL